MTGSIMNIVETFVQEPEYWITSLDGVKEYLEKHVKKGAVSVAGHSAGGREILVYAYGEKEDLPQTVSFSSAFAAKKPELYTRAPERKKLSLFIYGAIHGAEVEGTAGLLNLINLLEHGTDLRGRKNDALLKLAEQYRIVIVPLSQPDGRARFRRNSLAGQSLDVFQYYAHGVWKDGTPCKYPYHKEVMPLPVNEFEQLGAYFNDNGVNCQHDDFFGNIQPETQTLINLVHEERPDCILSCHSCEADPGMSTPAATLTDNGLRMVQQIAASVMANQIKANLRPYHRVNLQQGRAFILQDILYMASGGLPLLYEFPHGCVNIPFTHDEIIDLGLILFEEIMKFGVETGFKNRF
ncbi:MAG: hypothetical protein E7040_08855 [Lentisphaerae bacterium]|nr:hypothetical protein [Lentisphaerota bacterium]